MRVPDIQSDTHTGTHTGRQTDKTGTHTGRQTYKTDRRTDRADECVTIVGGTSYRGGTREGALSVCRPIKEPSPPPIGKQTRQSNSRRGRERESWRERGEGGRQETGAASKHRRYLRFSNASSSVCVSSSVCLSSSVCVSSAVCLSSSVCVFSAVCLSSSVCVP